MHPRQNLFDVLQGKGHTVEAISLIFSLLFVFVTVTAAHVAAYEVMAAAVNLAASVLDGERQLVGNACVFLLCGAPLTVLTVPTMKGTCFIFVESHHALPSFPPHPLPFTIFFIHRLV